MAATFRPKQQLVLLGAALLLLLVASAAAHGGMDAGHPGNARHRHASRVKTLKSSAATASALPQHKMHRRHDEQEYCSCAHQDPLPVWPQPTWAQAHDAHITSEDAGSNSEGGTMSHYRQRGKPGRHYEEDDEGDSEGPYRHRHTSHEELERDNECEACNTLPRVKAGGECGAALGICQPGLCCSQTGHCSKFPEDCDGTCQCAYSGPGSKCKGSLPFKLPHHLPTAGSGRPCGEYVAVCPRGECCSQFGFCLPDGSQFCKAPSCNPLASPLSSTCVDANALKSNRIVRIASAPAIDVASPNFAYQRGNVRRFDWVVRWKNETLDGFERPVIVFNDEVFPNLFVNVGDRVIVKVKNLLNEGLSIHWHGMLQRRTNIMDGVVPVTQRPIQPGQSFIYNFIADTPGTFWWHSHFSTQYVDGAWGALIIKDPTGTNLPSDNVLTMNEWYHELANPLTQYYLSPASQGNEPVPYDALMNGQGQGYCINEDLTTCKYSRIKGIASTCSNPQTLLRLVNAGAFAVFNVSVDNHKLFVVGEDGVSIDPVGVGSLQINNGQRYGVIVCQDTAGPVNLEPVWIRATMIDANFAYPSSYNATLAVLYYRDEDADAIPTTQPDFQAPALSPDQAGIGIVNPYFLRVVEGVVPPGPATTVLNYLIYFYNEPPTDPDATQYAHFSNISLSMTPNAPSLLERLTNNPEHLPPPRTVPNPPGGLGWHNVEIPRGAIVDIIINNNDTGEHPIHLHGHWFWVMDGGLPNAGDFNATEGYKPGGGRLARDTVTVNLKSYIVLRYMAVNPGTWIMHCHIDWHLAGGLGLILQEAFPPYLPYAEGPYDEDDGDEREL